MRDYHGGKQVILWSALAQHLMFFFYLFTTPGRSLVTMWRNAVIWEGIVAGGTQIYRLCLLVVISALLTLTTSPAQLAHGLEAVLGPLARVGLPVRELAMVLAIALRFVPTLFNETDRIVRAERARGADLRSRSPWQRVRSWPPVRVHLRVRLSTGR